MDPFLIVAFAFIILVFVFVSRGQMQENFIVLPPQGPPPRLPLKPKRVNVTVINDEHQTFVERGITDRLSIFADGMFLIHIERGFEKLKRTVDAALRLVLAALNPKFQFEQNLLKNQLKFYICSIEIKDKIFRTMTTTPSSVMGSAWSDGKDMWLNTAYTNDDCTILEVIYHELAHIIHFRVFGHGNRFIYNQYELLKNQLYGYGALNDAEFFTVTSTSMFYIYGTHSLHISSGSMPEWFSFMNDIWINAHNVRIALCNDTNSPFRRCVDCQQRSDPNTPLVFNFDDLANGLAPPAS